MKKHRAPTIALMFLLVVGLLAGCGDDDSTADAAPDSSAPTDGDIGDSRPRDALLDVELGDVPRDVPVPPDNGRAPILNNFRVTAAFSDRVYFDSDKPIRGASTAGFLVPEETVEEVVINAGSLIDHYVRLAEPLDYWDNKTIRYEGGSDIRDLSDRALVEFTLSYVDNRIPEPDAAMNRYVTVDAAGGGDGFTEASAWTFAEAMGYAEFTGPGSYNHFEGQAEAGQTVWVKAGDYGAQLLSIQLDGTPTAPIKFIGYRETPGDITSNYWDYTTTTRGDYRETWSTDQMPTLTGSDPFEFEALQLRGANYVVIRNLQITNYAHGIRANSSLNTNIVLDRINGHTFGAGRDAGTTFISTVAFEGAYPSPYASNSNFKVLDSRCVNATLTAIAIYGDGNTLLDGNKTYCDRPEPDAVQDYHQAVNGDYNIIRNAYAENFNTETSATSHGIGIRGDVNLRNNYNLIERSTAINIVEGLYIRNVGCDYNVIKDSHVGNNDNRANYLARATSGGVWIWGGANFNTVERVTVDECYYGLVFRDVQEEAGVTDTSIGHDNVVRNCVFNRTKFSVFISGSVDSLLNDNQVVGCTFNNSETFLEAERSIVENLQFINTIVTNHRGRPALVSPGGVSFQNSVFFGNGDDWSVGGDGNVNVDPRFVSDTDLHLSGDTPTEVSEGGAAHPSLRYDLDGTERTLPYSIGSYERD